MKTKNYKHLSRIPILISFLIFMNALLLQSADIKDNSKILDEYIMAQGYQDVIVFDASNIKQFWIDKSVFGKNGLITIQLKGNTQKYESIPLRIQLANVNVTLKGKIDVFSEDPSLSFMVLNDKSESISISKSNSTFFDCSIVSSEFRILSLQDNAFFLKFSSETHSSLSINKIVLSFSLLDNFTNEIDASMLTKENLALSSSTFCEEDEITVCGKRSKITFKRYIPIDKKEDFWASAKIKNVGNQPTKIYFGYQVYNKDGTALNGKNYPFNLKSPILNVISAEQGSNTIVVDQYTLWSKNSYIALDAMEDYSDIPNVNLLSQKVVSITKESNGQATITLDSPLQNSLDKGSKIRIHGLSGTYIYMDVKNLNPGDELVFSSVIKKDDNFLQYSSTAFSRGVFFINPIILSYSNDANETNTILVSDFQLYSFSKK